MIPVVKLCLPASAAFLLIALAVGLLLLRKARTNLFGQRWIGAILVLYAMFSMPVTARWLAKPLAWGFHPVENLERCRNPQAIVVLDAGTARCRNSQQLVEIPLNTSVLRALEVARIYHILDNPLVIVSGGDDHPDSSWGPEASALRDQLIKAGVPEDHLVLDSRSPNTRAHAVNIVKMLQERGIEDFVLVTSPSHMRRTVWAFQAEGAHPISSPCQGSLDNHRGWQAIMPSNNVLEFTEGTMHEYVGILWYFMCRYI